MEEPWRFVFLRTAKVGGQRSEQGSFSEVNGYTEYTQLAPR